MMMGDDFIEGWYARLRGAATDALAYLAGAEASPVSDGILIDWIDTLCALRYTDEDVPLVVRIIDKSDPHLQEAGVRLANAVQRSVDAGDALEPALARLVNREIDLWVLESLVGLLAYSRHSFVTVYEGLAKIHGKSRTDQRIMRNRAIHPWQRLVQVYEQHAVQTLRPLVRDLAYLPILEREHGTHGWEPTVRHILLKMGFDPDDHFNRLRGR